MNELDVAVRRLLRSPRERAFVGVATVVWAIAAIVLLARFPRAFFPVVGMSVGAWIGVRPLARRLFGGREGEEAEELRRRLARGDYRERAHPAVADALERLAKEANGLVARFARPDFHPELRDRTLTGVDGVLREAIREAAPWYRPVGGKKKEFASRLAADPEPEAARWMEDRRAELARLAADLDGPKSDPLATVRQDLTLRRQAERELDGL